MMKLSELSTEKAMDVLCEITPPLSEILSDEELIGELSRAIFPEGVQTITKFAYYRAGLDKISKILPIILGKKREAAYTIIAAVNFMSIADVKKQNIMTTCSQVREIVMDEVFADFVKSCIRTEKSE